MNYKKAIKNILKNKEGITLNLKGNISLNKKGFYCSITNNIIDLNKRDLKTEIKKLLLNINKLPKLNKYYIGAWINQDNKLFLDITKRFYNQNKAIETGIEFNQEAIFNLNKLECINIKGGLLK